MNLMTRFDEFKCFCGLCFLVCWNMQAVGSVIVTLFPLDIILLFLCVFCNLFSYEHCTSTCMMVKKFFKALFSLIFHLIIKLLSYFSALVETSMSSKFLETSREMLLFVIGLVRHKYCSDDIKHS